MKSILLFCLQRSFLPIIAIGMLLTIIAGVVAGWNYYAGYYTPNITVNGNTAYLYIHTGANFEEVLDSLKNMQALKNERHFVRAAKRMKYPGRIKPGRYKLTQGMNNKTLLHNLILGIQTPVRLTLSGHIRTNRRLAMILSRYIEADSLALLAGLNDSSLTGQYGYTPATIIGMFITNTYEVYWNTSVNGILQRMKREYDAFWNESRRKKAADINLTPQQVMILASIINEESLKTEELPYIAGVYINRLKKNMLLQADPTLKYATGDFSLRRILNRHKTIDSPYNTYRYAGLPPGVICVPAPTAINAVLDYERHNYLYFCAKSDFSGYHTFATTLTQHNQNALAYQKALSRRKIYR